MSTTNKMSETRKLEEEIRDTYITQVEPVTHPELEGIPICTAQTIFRPIVKIYVDMRDYAVYVDKADVVIYKKLENWENRRFNNEVSNV